MAIKKSELYSSLWQSCDELRGGMDASQYKDYVLTLLFMKYVSDKYAGKPDALIDVPKGGGFADMVKLKGDKEIGEKIDKIIAKFAEANDLRNVIDIASFNNEEKLGRGKEMVDRLSRLVGIFEGLDFRANRAEGDDLLGDGYEYLMRHFATESGKSKGQFYTPAEVSRIMAKVVGIGNDTRPNNTIYDPTCGSGSLLIKAADEAPRGITIYGQEMDVATWALAQMNMILHGHPTRELWRGNKNRLRAQDIHKIVDVFNRQTELPRYARLVPIAEIANPANDYNLNIPRYIDSSELENLHDLDAHLNGGIPNRDIDALAAYWAVFPALRAVLFKPDARPNYSEPKIETQQVKPTILAHAEFKAYADRLAGIFDGWRKAHASMLKGLKINDLPRQVIYRLSEDLLARFADLPLLNKYDVYQRLMDYWAETMQDDVYLIAADGWLDAARPRAVIDDKEKKIKETPDLTLGRKKYKMDLIPPALIVARYFPDEQAAIDALQAKLEAVTRELEEFVEEHIGDEGLLEDATNDKGKVTKGAVKDRLKEVGSNPELADEHGALENCLKLIEAEAEASKAVKDAQTALDEKVLKQYAKLTENEIKALVVDDKWFAAIQAAIEGEVQRLTQQLATRVKELKERYVQPLPQLERDVEDFGIKVEVYLKKMGLAWA